MLEFVVQVIVQIMLQVLRNIMPQFGAVRMAGEMLKALKDSGIIS